MRDRVASVHSRVRGCSWRARHLRGARGRASPDALPSEVDARIKAGSDWIKVYASRGSFDSVDTTQTLAFDQIKAIVDAAHAGGRRVAVHSYGAPGVKDAVRAGADSIEHGIELDDEALAELVKRRTVWVPTIDHNRYYVDAREEYGFHPRLFPPRAIHREEPRVRAPRGQGGRAAGDGL
jgi:imidazolonepropionase-like amidohydrolase